MRALMKTWVEMSSKGFVQNHLGPLKELVGKFFAHCQFKHFFAGKHSPFKVGYFCRR
uniref:Uncharacterized protein n=1 Tax=mine drainage metagenome TaxID=410659 RepID=E6QU13_9ZZZZ